MDINAYAFRHSKRHSVWERKAAPIFYKAIADSVAPVLRTLNPDDIRRDVWVDAYQKVYSLVGTKAAVYEYNFLKRDSIKAAGGNPFYNEIWRQAMIKYGQDMGIGFSDTLTDTTLNQIRAALVFGTANYYTNEQIAQAIRDYTMGNIGKARAFRIGRTECTTCSSIGKMEASKTYFKEIGEEEGYKMWITREDSAVRSSHVQENRTMVKFDENFKLEHGKGMYPGDPNLPAEDRVNCRCSFVAMSKRQYLRYLENNRGKVDS